ncbi:hexose transporter [Grosmannia clavigera kw1407]|uniref:Hexose transporter n=1 Tax=Grosmannia clavigera (strain kw1407 / UAMH 11150) TaxID=655863 RepID=F0XBE1_GROCL|nr:hexose transporter [Grosmannia clavigera kw1407]EFX05030.1 hexose transporter [Grosmannia clavigera kw1407]
MAVNDYLGKSNRTLILLLWCSSIMSTSLGFDASMMNSLNILPSYTDYFKLDTATLALQSAISWAGMCVASFFYGTLTDYYGRKKAMWLSAIITLVGVVIQAAAQDIAMFVVARFIVGLGNGATYVCGPIYLAECFPTRWRGPGLALFTDMYYVGSLIAAGVTYGTAKILNTWAWRTPSILQGFLMVLAVVALPWMPESPRWLIHKDRHEEALDALADTHGNGNRDDPHVTETYNEIVSMLQAEIDLGKEVGFKEIVKSRSNGMRILLCCSVAVISMLSGNNIISYYLGQMLDQAGITDSTTQLEINIVLSLWCLVVALVGTYTLDNVGRKPLAIYSSIALTILIFVFGALTKTYGNSTQTSGIYGTVAVLFLFQGAYSFAWTPLAMLYPPEILNFSIRSSGMAVYTFLSNGLGLMVTMAFPYALAKIGWKTYMINGAWDVLQVLFVIYFWVETKDKSLENINEIFEGPAATKVLEGEDVAYPSSPVYKSEKGATVTV